MSHFFKLFILMMLVPSTNCLAAIPVKFEVSKIHGLVNFVETISGRWTYSRTLKAAYEESRFNNAENRDLIAEYLQIRNHMANGYQFKGYPESRDLGQSIDKFFLIQSAFVNPAKGLDELKSRTTGLLPVKVSNRYFEILTHFLPIYESLIWNPNEKKLYAFLNSIKKKSTQWQLPVILGQINTFYNANWSDRTPFYITFYPIPGAKGHSTAESQYNFESVGVLVDDLNDEEIFGTIVHELCHSLHAEQDPAFQHQLDGWFTAHDSPHAKIAYQYIDEALATAIGQGWSYQKVSGKKSEKSWYAHRQTDQYARALFPVVSRYFDTGNTLDAPFVKEAVAIFAKEFPEAPREFENLFRELTIITDGKDFDAREIGNSFREKMRIPSLRRCSPLDKPEAVQCINEFTNATVLIIVSEAEKAQLNELAKGFPPVKTHLQALTSSAKNVMVGGFTADNKPFVLVKLSDKSQLKAFIEKLLEVRRIDGLQTPLMF